MSFPRYGQYKDSGIGWLGPVPVTWRVAPLKVIARVINGYPFDAKLFDPADGFPLVRIRDLNQCVPDARYKGEFLDAASINNDDVLIGMDGDFNVGRWLGEVPALLNQRMCCVRAYSPMVTRYLQYVLPQPLKAINDVTYSTTVKHLSSFDVLKIAVAMPPSSTEVGEIVSFLDCETTKIDALVEEQRRLIELLKEKRQAVISQAVTKGLSPNVATKDSGVKWLGEVPAHWGMTKLKHLVAESVAGPYGASLTKDMYTSSGYRVYGQQQVIPDDFTVGDYYISEAKFDEMRRYSVYKGDVLVSVMGTIGKVAVVPGDVEPGIINPRLVRYRCSECIRPRYLQRVLLSQKHQEHLLFEAKGTTMDGLNMSTLGKVPVPVPPLAEQAQIVEWLSSIQDETDALVVEAEKAAALLLERRAALISAAVTGKIDVRGLVPQPEAVAA